jgi:hypothetical protein
VNSGDFTVHGGTCNPGPSASVVLPPELKCDLAVHFTPTALGSRSAELLFSTNVPGQPQQTVPMMGLGTATPVVSVSPSSLAFPAWPVNKFSPTQVVTLTNHDSTPLILQQVRVTGTHPNEFAVPSASDTCSGAQITGGGTCSVEVTFAPRTIGSRDAQLVFADSSGSQHIVSLAGTGVGPLISFEPSSLAFEALPVGAFSQRQQVFLNNTGNAPLLIRAVSVTGDFVHSTWCDHVVPGGFCVVTVVFRPSAVGTRSGQIIVTSNAGSTPQTVDLTGIGLAASMSLDPSVLSFGSQQVGTAAAPQVIRLTSSGPAALSIDSIVASGDFQVASHTCDIRPEYQPVGTSCKIEVIFAPSTTGVTSGVLTVTSDALDSPHVVTLSGSGN